AAVHTPFPNTVVEMPNFAPASAVAVAAPDVPFRDSIARRAYEQAGIGPEDVSFAEVYDLSTALERDWYENIGLAKPGDAEKILRDGVTTLGGKQPVNPSGGLGCFGEAIPAQGISQPWELALAVGGPGRPRAAAH